MGPATHHSPAHDGYARRYLLLRWQTGSCHTVDSQEKRLWFGSRDMSRCMTFFVVCFVISCGRLLATEKLPGDEQKTIGNTIAMVGIDGGAFRRCEYEPALPGPLNVE